MRRKSEIVFKAHLNRSEMKEALLRFLPEEEKLYLAELPEEGKQEAHPFSFEKVHWSWFLPTLQSFPAKDQRLFLHVFDPYAREQLEASLALKEGKEEVTETAKSFLRQKLLSGLDAPQEGLLPTEYLPASPLNRLVTLSKKDLIRLINSLALYDLAQEVRQIVETKTLKKIYALLSEEQKAILKQITIHKGPSSLPKLGIEKWEGSKESLQVLLHRRGLTRLSVALAGQDPDLIWMICHQLDIGRGGTLFKFCGREKKSGAADGIIRQIEELLGSMNLSHNS